MQRGQRRGSREDLAAYLDEALAAQAAGTALPFATVDLASSRVVGSTRFGNAALAHGRVEIGWTWIAAPWQRTAVNTEVKTLLLTHAFERLGCIRVEFKTDERNQRSQRALERIGATREGVLRNHMIVQGGFYRNSVYFSVIEEEWPAVRERLESLL